MENKSKVLMYITLKQLNTSNDKKTKLMQIKKQIKALQVLHGAPLLRLHQAK